jgi:hypothetical protein
VFRRLESTCQLQSSKRAPKAVKADHIRHESGSNSIKSDMILKVNIITEIIQEPEKEIQENGSP